MPVKTTHPRYADMLDAWRAEQHAYGGERVIKRQGTEYLPMTPVQESDGADGVKRYEAYKMRAVYPGDYKRAIDRFLGSLHHNPPVVELPTNMEDFKHNASTLGESLAQVLRRVNRYQLSPGRVGVLGDLRVTRDGVTPKLSLYSPTSVLDWDDTEDLGDSANLRYVVLDETGWVREAGAWIEKERYRVLAMCSYTGNELRFDTENGRVYGTALLGPGDEIETAVYRAPNNAGAVLESIPFAFVNATSTASTPEVPPLEALSSRCAAIYRGEADHRWGLYQQSQETFVTIGGPDAGEVIPLGAGARVNIPAVPHADAKFVGVSAAGLDAQRATLDADYNYIKTLAGDLIDTTSASKESGSALKRKLDDKVTSLYGIAINGGAAVEHVTKTMTGWFGASPDDVRIKPNLEFDPSEVSGDEMTKIANAKLAGWPISERSMHAYGAERGLTTMDYEAELLEIASEAPRM